MIGFTIVLNKRKKHKIKKKKNRRKILYFLSVILIAVFSVCVAGFFEEEETEKEIFEAEDIQVFKEIDDYSAYYNPVVMNGFFSYEKGEKTENEVLVELGVWSILCTEETEKYEAFDGELALPKEEVEERIKLLFSEDIDFQNTSSGEIIFDEEASLYTIPTIGFSPEYVALLKSVTAEKGKTKLEVSCLKSESFKQDSSGKTVLPEAEKNIVITLKKDKNSFYIESISEV